MTNDPLVVGLDPSLTATGLAWPNGRSEVGGRKGVTTLPYVERGRALKAMVVDIHNMVQSAGLPALVVIEELPREHLDSERAYLWWSLMNLCDWAHTPVLVVQPSQIKKFATGKGNAAKAAVVEACARRMPQFETKGNDNRADAAWLCAIGRAMLGAPIVELPLLHMQALAKLKLPEGVVGP